MTASSEPRIFVASVILSAATAAICTPGPVNPLSIPLDDREFTAIRGADIQFATTVKASCESKGLTAITNDGTFVYAASDCSSVNIGQNCGACETTASSDVGKPGAIVPPGTGQQNVGGPTCGRATIGTCGVTNPNPPTYGCQGMVIYIDNDTGLPVQCSDLIKIGNQT